MYSIAFPQIFDGSTVRLVKDADAVKSNLKNLLASNRGGLFGDPHYGTALKPILWDQAADAMMKELIKDEVYEAVLSYMPQTTIDRDNILVESVGNYVRVSIRAENDLGVVSDLMEITLLKSDEQV